MLKQSKHWQVSFIGDFYSGDLYYDQPLNERQVRARLRQELKRKRLPRRTILWAVDEAEFLKAQEQLEKEFRRDPLLYALT